MKHILISTLLIVTLLNGKLIAEIKRECENINYALDSFRKKLDKDINVYKDINPDKYSIEGESIHGLAMINLSRYYDENGLRKAVVYFEGDRQDLVSEYYFKYDALIFAYKKCVNYSHPKWSDDFNILNKTIDEDYYYFKQNKLVKWIDSEMKSVDGSSISNSISAGIISDSDLYKIYGE